MIKLTKHQVLQMHESLIKQFGGMGGIRDEGLLDAAFPHPFSHFPVKIYSRHSRQKQHASHMAWLKIMPCLMGING